MAYKRKINGEQKYIDSKLIKLIKRIKKKYKCSSFIEASFIVAKNYEIPKTKRK